MTYVLSFLQIALVDLAVDAEAVLSVLVQIVRPGDRVIITASDVDKVMFTELLTSLGARVSVFRHRGGRRSNLDMLRGDGEVRPQGVVSYVDATPTRNGWTTSDDKVNLRHYSFVSLMNKEKFENPLGMLVIPLTQVEGVYTVLDAPRGRFLADRLDDQMEDTETPDPVTVVTFRATKGDAVVLVDQRQLLVKYNVKAVSAETVEMLATALTGLAESGTPVSKLVVTKGMYNVLKRKSSAPKVLREDAAAAVRAAVRRHNVLLDGQMELVVE